MTDNFNDHSRLLDDLERTIKDRMVRAMEAGGKLQKQMSEALGWDETKVSKTVRAHRSVAGARTPTADDVKAWAAVVGESDESRDETLRLLSELKAARRDWKERLRGGRSPVHREYETLFARATHLRVFQAAVIPGIFQIADYARQLFTDLNDATPDVLQAVDADVQARLAYGQYLYRSDKRFEVILAESALRLTLADPPVMRMQLDRLLSASTMPNVRLGIIPQMQRIRSVLFTGFVAFDDVVTVENPINDTIYRGKEAQVFLMTMDRYWTDAVEGDEARKLIRRVMDEYAAI